MKRKLLGSLMTIGIMASMLGASTFAYFSDIETSTNNTFTAGTIDLSAPYDITYSPEDLKPCQTRYLTLKVHNDGNNEMDVWKHIKNVVCAENGITEPEQTYYDTNNINYLIGYWRFEETTPWDGTPDEVKDSSTFENNGTAINGAIQYNPGKVGQCAEFDGDNDYISINPSDYQFGTGESFTAECWIRTDEIPDDREEIFGIYSSPSYPIPNQFWSLFLETSGKVSFWIRVDDNTAQSMIYSTNPVNDNQWHHIAMVKDVPNGILRLYIDGNPETPVAFIDGETANGNGLHIADGCWNRYYDGLVDELAIWGGVIPSSEIEDHYNNPGVIEDSGKNDIDTVILYDMWIDNDGDTSGCDENAGDVWIIQESEGFHIDDIECFFIYLGTLSPGETFTIVQSYHMEADTKNWAQSDTMTFDIEFFAQQTPGNPPPPGSELRRHTELEDIDSGLTSPTGSYRWLDVADQLYSTSYRTSYDYTQANVDVTYAAIGNTLHGTLNAINLKPNFAYQLKLVGTGSGTPDEDANEHIGYTGRWWREEWDGTAWTSGTNSNDADYNTHHTDLDLMGGSPTGLKYKFTGYLLFDYFTTDENGDAQLNFEADSSYHVLWKPPPAPATYSQHARTADDGPLKISTFDADLSAAYDDIVGDDYPSQTVGIYGEWERLPVGGKYLPSADYSAQMILTEESFHGSGASHVGNWAAAMGGNVQFKII